MNTEIFVVLRHGVYINGVGGAFSSFGKAITAAEKLNE